MENITVESVTMDNYHVYVETYTYKDFPQCGNDYVSRPIEDCSHKLQTKAEEMFNQQKLYIWNSWTQKEKTMRILSACFMVTNEP